MGTRGFIGFKDKEGNIHGWYNHWDSYETKTSINVDGRVIHSAFSAKFIPEQDVLLVEIQGTELFSRFVSQGRADIGHQSGPRRQHGAAAGL